MTRPLIDITAAFPNLAERLAAEHVDDGTGHCAACPVGHQDGHRAWPCALHDLALVAAKQRDEGEGG